MAWIYNIAKTWKFWPSKESISHPFLGSKYKPLGSCGAEALRQSWQCRKEPSQDEFALLTGVLLLGFGTFMLPTALSWAQKWVQPLPKALGSKPDLFFGLNCWEVQPVCLFLFLSCWKFLSLKCGVFLLDVVVLQEFIFTTRFSKTELWLPGK